MKIKYRVWGDHELNLEAQSFLTALFRDKALYVKVPLSEDLRQACLEILFLKGLRMDTWCIDCQKESTFTLAPILNAGQIQNLATQSKMTQSITAEHELDTASLSSSLRWLVFSCARDTLHSINYVCQHSTTYFVNHCCPVKE